MTPRLTKEFKQQTAEHFLQIAVNLIPEQIDKEDRSTTRIERRIDTGSERVRITRISFPARGRDPHYEDFSVCINSIIDGQEIFAHFWIEWATSDQIELIPAPTWFNPNTGEKQSKYHLTRSIKIKKREPVAARNNLHNVRGIEYETF
jgi:hypothetical protein